MSPERDPEYPSPIWVPPYACEHPYEQVRLQAGYFPPKDPEQLSVFWMYCFKCGSKWDHNSRGVPWLYEYIGRMIAEGEFIVISDDADIVEGAEWRRQTRWDQIMKDLAGDENPILSSKVELRRPD